MPIDLELTLNAQFYRLRNDVADQHIQAILDAATQNASGEPMLADIFRADGEQLAGRFRYRYSLKVFRSVRPVYFLADPDAFDLIHAYLLLIEIAGFLIVSKKGVANISDEVESAGWPLRQNELVSTFDDDQVQFQKLSVRNMTVSEKAVRARSYEASDLKGVISTHAAGRAIPYFLRIRGEEGLSTISLSASRLVDSSVRVSVLDVAKWASQKIRLIQAGRSNSSFMSAFAQSVDLNSVMKTTQPSSVLVDGGGLGEYLLAEKLVLHYTNSEGVEAALPKRAVELVFRALERVYEIDSDLRVVGSGTGSKIRRNKKSLSIVSRRLSRIFVNQDGKRVSLLSIINSEGLFTICFADPRFMYFMGSCFEDRSGKSEISRLLDVLVPVPALSTTVSEKGEFRTTSVSFSNSSVFSCVEVEHRSDSYIFCDDLGTEWADHVCLNLLDSCVTFVHSKFGAKSLSASNLHDVVGQAIKNFGNMFFSESDFMSKYNRKWKNNYVHDGVRTKIARTRKGRAASLRGDVRTILGSYALYRKFVLACSFLSKADMEREFAKIRAGRRVRGNVAQLFWIISSFVHAARETAVVPVIYCCE